MDILSTNYYAYAVDVPLGNGDKAAKWLYERNMDYIRVGFGPSIARFRLMREEDTFEFILTWA